MSRIHMCAHTGMKSHKPQSILWKSIRFVIFKEYAFCTIFNAIYMEDTEGWLIVKGKSNFLKDQHLYKIASLNLKINNRFSLLSPYY
jgi:hypothetical protein